MWAFLSPSGPLLPLRVFSYIIYFFLDHPGPTLVSHLCLYLSACPISHSFRRFVSCSDPGSIVQGSCPHKWGQDVSCGYLMRRWQLILELLFHYTPMAVSLRGCFPLGRSGRLPLVAWHFFLLGVGLGLDMKWVGVAKFFGPTIHIYKYFLLYVV